MKISGFFLKYSFKSSIFFSKDFAIKIVRLFLCYEKMCVCDLADVLEMKQSPISQHLRK
ncbi:MAG TPA: ArsR family transcriptional regulator, partial [Candidatus Omnitrophica bacterium]|nr:ArsR family transcriptional regulator [Candidatus Omnitrophota bacterium]